MIDRIMAKIDGLEFSPQRRPETDELVNVLARKLLVKPYRILFVFDEAAGVVRVLSIRHGAMDRRNLN